MLRLALWGLAPTSLALVLCISGCSEELPPPATDRGIQDKGPVIDDKGVDQPQPDMRQAEGGLEDGAPVGDLAVFDGPLVTDCAGKADGEICGFEVICVDEQCVGTRCGDGYVHAAAGEECEDDNEEAGDGCTNCRFDCKKNADCDDGNLCNGQEGCVTHTCSGGTAPVPSTPCKKDDGSDGVCSSGECVDAGCGNKTKDGKEDCDDGNDVPNDGCEADCTFSCQQDADCDDGNPCTGTETCDKSNPAKPVCKAGTNVTCTSTYAGCKGACNPSTGKCVFQDVDKDGASCDKDCKDADPAVFPGAPECADGKDNDCDPSTADGADGDCKCYEDRDGDGFAAAGAKVITAVKCDKGYTATAPGKGTTDCLDSRSDVSPVQRGWFEKPYLITKIPLKFSFDYNCANGWEKRYTTLYNAKGCTSFSRCSAEGWTTTAVPACGVEAEYKTCARSKLSLSCTISTAKRRQTCH